MHGSDADDETDRPEFARLAVLGGKIADPPGLSVPADSAEGRRAREEQREAGGRMVDRREPDEGTAGAADSGDSDEDAAPWVGRRAAKVTTTVADLGNSDGNDAPWIGRREPGVTTSAGMAAAMTVGETGDRGPRGGESRELPEVGGRTVDQREPDQVAAGAADLGSYDESAAAWIARRGPNLTTVEVPPPPPPPQGTGDSDQDDATWIARRGAKVATAALPPPPQGAVDVADLVNSAKIDAPWIGRRGAGVTTAVGPAAMTDGGTGGIGLRATPTEGSVPPSSASVQENLVGLEPDGGGESVDSDGNDEPRISRRPVRVIRETTTTMTTTMTTTADMPATRQGRSPVVSRCPSPSRLRASPNPLQPVEEKKAVFQMAPKMAKIQKDTSRGLEEEMVPDREVEVSFVYR